MNNSRTNRHYFKKVVSTFTAMALSTATVANTFALTVPSITAPYGIVTEPTTGKVIYSKNADSLFIPASFSKVMTMYIVFEEIQAGNLSMNDLIYVSQKNATLSITYPAKVALQANSYVPVETLVLLALIPSGRAACIVLAEHIAGSESAFLQRMNETAKRLSMDATYADCHGASVYSKVTARDQARLLQVFLEQFPEITNYTTRTSVTHYGKTYTLTNKLVLPSSIHYDPYVLGVKTGTTAYGGNNLSAYSLKNGQGIISVVGISNSENNRYYDSRKLLDYGYGYLDLDPSYFNDTADFPELELIYESFRQMGVNMQTINGWVRPTEPTTYGEFCITLISALEKTALMEPITLGRTIPDLENYCHKDILYRGINYGILPLQADGNFNPDRPITYDEINILLDWVAHLFQLDLNIVAGQENQEEPELSFGTNTPDDVDNAIPEEELTQETLSTSYNEEQEEIDEEQEAQLEEEHSEPESQTEPDEVLVEVEIDETPLSRGYSTKLIYQFLQDNALI